MNNKMNCLTCSKKTKKNSRKFCSSRCYGAWMRGKVIGENARNWQGGKVTKNCKQCKKEFKTKKSLLRVEFCNRSCAKIGSTPWNKIGDGITPQNELIRQSIPYKEWRMSVFQRDRFTCVNCGYRSHKPKDIRADHIKPFSLYPELRFDINNGRTFCIECDLKLGWQLFREDNPKKKVTTANKADMFGFYAKTSTTFDGFVLGANI